MGRRVSVAGLGILRGAGQVAACSVRGWDANDLVENTPVYSANARFCVVVRWREGLSDFTNERAGTYFHMDDPAPPDEAEHGFPPPPKTVIAALYEMEANARRLLAEIPLDIEKTGQVLVTDSGRYLVAVRGPGSRGCNADVAEGDPLITVYDAKGAQAGALKVVDVFTPSDVLQFSLNRVGADFSLRHETQDREVVVIAIPTPRQEGKEMRYVERRVDVATAEVLDERRNIYPVPRSYATPA